MKEINERGDITSHTVGDNNVRSQGKVAVSVPGHPAMID